MRILPLFRWVGGPGAPLLLLLLLLGCDHATQPAAAAASSTHPDDGAWSSAPIPTASASATAAQSSGGAPPAGAVVRLAGGGPKAIEGRFGMVSSEDEPATRIGVEVLQNGGNAIDAAVAVGYAHSVTHHVAGSLGGGGFMIVRLQNGETHAVDFRETAPAKATVALNEKQLKGGAHGYLSAPVPGVVAGFNLARERFGTKPLAELIAPSVKLAREGHPYSERQSLVVAWYWNRLQKDPTLKALLGRGQGDERPINRGELLKQPSLAKTLEAIAAQGDAGFYQGDVAAKIAAAMKKRGGLVTVEDLAGYRAKLREPLHLAYRGFDVYTMPPPSMGGIALYGMLQSLAAAKSHEVPADSAAGLHLFVEASRRSYADRRSVGADPDHIDRARVGPLLERLLDPAYYAQRPPPIDRQKATPSSALVPIQGSQAALGQKPPSDQPESPETTHFSVVDRFGNAVACTMTLSAAFGAHVAIPETGILPSNAMGAFSPDGANTLAPGKRPASSMTPTVLVQNGKVVAVLGSPGGDTIPGTVAQVLRNLVDGGMTIDRAVDAPRLHQQWLPDEVRIETTRQPPAPVLAELGRLGHTIVKSPQPQGDCNAIVIDEHGVAWGYSDSRKGGLALGPSAPAGSGPAAAP